MSGPLIGRLLRRQRKPEPGAGPSHLREAVTAEGVEDLFRLMMRRPVWDDGYLRHLVDTRATYAEVIDQLRRSDELASHVAREISLMGVGTGERLERAAYITPPELRPPGGEGGRCLVVGSCLLDAWPDIVASACPGWVAERVLFNNVAALPKRTAQEMAGVDFQVLHLPLRFVLPDTVYFELIGGLRPVEELMAGCVERLAIAFETLTTYARVFSVPAFVLSFLTPQRHPLGRFGEVHTPANTIRFVDALNAELERLCRAAPAVFFYDIDQTAGLYGKKYLQDDLILNYNHGGLLGNIEIFSDVDRLHPVGNAVDVYRPRHLPIIGGVFGDIIGAYRSLQQTGAIKLVVFDLDDTLWRGVAAEQEELGSEMIEGWPLGLVEAVATLHARGVLVALASKNDPARAEHAWRGLYQIRFPWEAFFAHEVSWGDKAEAVARIIAKANILPGAALFVDDNPVERARVQGALPGLRVLDAPVAEWKRILLWSPELQPAVVTAEAKGRAASLQPRPAAPLTTESRESFLARLDVQVAIDRADSMTAPAFDRLFELLNKTNQFNTTGRRWTLQELRALFDRGGRLLFARVRDAFSDYGITAIAMLDGHEIVQVVMSCRVFGLGVEDKLLAAAITDLRESGAKDILARTTPTGRNAPSLGLFAGAKFTGRSDGVDEVWRLAG